LQRKHLLTGERAPWSCHRAVGEVGFSSVAPMIGAIESRIFIILPCNCQTDISVVSVCLQLTLGSGKNFHVTQYGF